MLKKKMLTMVMTVVVGAMSLVGCSNTKEEVVENDLLKVSLILTEGGVNDVLANLLEIENVKSFDDPEIPAIGRIGDLKREMTEAEFAGFVKAKLNADSVTYTLLPDGRKIKKVAVLGGSASDAISSAALAGADAIVGGEFKHHTYGYAAVEAAGKGIALIEAGHYHTEYPVCEKLRELVLDAIPESQVDILHCNNTFVL